jgi:hypothetical protein
MGEEALMGYEIRTSETRVWRDDISDGGPRCLRGWTGRIVFVESDGEETPVPLPNGAQSPHGGEGLEGEKAVCVQLNAELAHLEQHRKTTGNRWELEPEQAERTARLVKDREAEERRRQAQAGDDEC